MGHLSASPQLLALLELGHWVLTLWMALTPMGGPYNVCVGLLGSLSSDN